MPHTSKGVRTFGSELYQSYPIATGASIAFGAALVFDSVTAGAETVTPAKSGQSILGFADKRMWLPKGGYDHFYTYGVDGLIPIVSKRAYALVVPNGANVNIDAGDYLEIAALGSNPTAGHGLLEEAGTTTGTTFTDDTVAQAEESVTMGSGAYKVPANDVAIGATTITMGTGDIATMDLDEGDLILLEDITGDLQVNAVAGLTSTVITLVKPSTVALSHSANDLVTKIFQCKVRTGKF